MTAYILLADGFEEIEAVAPGDILRRGGVDVKYASVSGAPATGARGITLLPDTAVAGIMPKADDYIVVPGGLRGVENLETSTEVSELLLLASKAGAVLCAICAGPRALAKLGLLTGRDITCYPGMESEMVGAVCHPDAGVVTDGDRITGRAPGAAIDFSLALLENIKGKKTAADVKAALVYD